MCTKFGWCGTCIIAGLALALAGCDKGTGSGTGGTGATAANLPEFAPPEFDESSLPIGLQMKLASARREAKRVSTDPDKLFELGALTYVHGFPAVAVAAFRRNTQIAPDDFTWWYYMALAEEKAGNAAEAVAALRKAISIDDANVASGKVPRTYVPARDRIAALLKAQGKPDEAATFEPRSAEDERARLVGDVLGSRLLLRGADLSALLGAATAVAERGQFDEAEKFLLQAADVDPSGVKARTALGQLRSVQGRYEDATREFEYVLGLPEGKDYAQAKLGLALVLIRTQQLERAEQLVRDVLARDPRNFVALQRFALLASTQQQPDKFTPVYEAALASAPQDAELHQQISDLMYQLGNREKARELLNTALEIDPKSIPARYGLGMLLFQLGDKAGARAQWEKALEIEPRAELPRLSYVSLLITEKSFVEAEMALRAGLELNARSADLNNLLAWLLATTADESRRKPEEALKLAQTACELTSFGSPMHLDTLAAACAASGQFDEARKWINEAIKIGEAVRDPALDQFKKRQALYEQDKSYTE